MQERSKKRLEAILDAAAVEFSDAGYDGARVEAIAERAQTSVGSLYQFFPDKAALFKALAERCLERSRVALDALLADGGPRLPWPDLLDAMVDGFAALHASDPSFRAVLVNLQLYGLYADADVTLHRYIVQKVSRELRAIAPAIGSTRRDRIGSVIVATIAALLLVVQRAPPADARAMIAETKLMLHAYVSALTSE
jgi:AcrR family transcriptional regulator